MKKIHVEIVLILVLVGIGIGLAWSRWMQMEAQIANHNARIVTLEGDYGKRMKIKAYAGIVATLAAKWFKKLSFGRLQTT